MRKTNVVQVRIEEEEKQRWQVQAEAAKVSLSDWIRGRCNGIGEAIIEAQTRVAVARSMKRVRQGVGGFDVVEAVVPDVGIPEPRLPGAVDKPTLPLGVRCSRHKVVNCGRCGDGGGEAGTARG